MGLPPAAASKSRPGLKIIIPEPGKIREPMADSGPVQSFSENISQIRGIVLVHGNIDQQEHLPPQPQSLAPGDPGLRLAAKAGGIDKTQTSPGSMSTHTHTYSFSSPQPRSRTSFSISPRSTVSSPGGVSGWPHPAFRCKYDFHSPAVSDTAESYLPNIPPRPAARASEGNPARRSPDGRCIFHDYPRSLHRYPGIPLETPG